MKKILIIAVCLVSLTINAQIKPQLVLSAKSLAFPGWGLVEINDNTGKNIFWATEALSAFAAVTMSLKSSYYKTNSINYCSYNLNKDISFYPEEILLKMESYISSEDYNSLLTVKARELYPNSVEKQLDYVNSKSIPDSLSWEHASEERMREFSSLRSSSRQFREMAYYAISALLINHAVSAVYTYFKSVEYYRPLELNGGFGQKSFMFSIGARF